MAGGRAVLARRYGNNNNNPLGIKSILLYAILGVTVGILLGYTLMGTAHAVFEVRSTPQIDRSNEGSPQNKITSKSSSTSIHTLCTSNGSPYQNYQIRIAYSTYQLIQNMPGGSKHVSFTRILHRTVPDELMNEIPTFRADPLQPACDIWCEYPVSDRANAVQQFFDAAKVDPSLIKAKWIYMIESDYVFMKPLDLPPPNSENGIAWTFPFDYIQPRLFPDDMRKLYPSERGPISDIPGTGPAPALLSREDWEKITPDWERLAALIESDETMKKKLGWVREMYGFSVALSLNKIKVDMPRTPDNKFITQLPIDKELGEAHAFHYTQCTIYKDASTNGDVWGYDKRFHISREDALNVPLIDEPPAVYEGGKWKFVEGNPVDKTRHESIVLMVKQMNRGIATLKQLASS